MPSIPPKPGGGNSHAVIERILAGTSSLLDLGCNDGVLIAALRLRGLERAVGVDVNEGALQRAKSSVPWAQFLRADLERALPLAAGEGRRYDAVLAADILEHLRDPRPLLLQLRRSSAQGGLEVGRLVASIPNVAFWRVRWMLALGRWVYEDEGLMDRTHVQFYTRSTAEQLLADCGWHPTAISVTRPLSGRRWRDAVGRMLVRTWPGSFGLQFVFDCVPAALPDATHD